MHDTPTNNASDVDQYRQREENLRSALQELSQARSLRLDPVPDIGDEEHGASAPTRTRRGLFTFAQRARSAARDS